MAYIAESLSACVAIAASIQSDFPSDSVTHNLFSDPSQKFPVMKAHIDGLLDTAFMLRIGTFEKQFGGLGALRDSTCNNGISEREEDNQN